LRIGEGGGDKYLNAMKKKIIDHFYYPPTAEMFHITGTAVYKVQIDRQGQLMGMLVYLSTNSELLDDAGLKAIEMAAPFGPLPADFAVGASSVVLEVTVPMQ
jgi:protein TonB